MKTLSIKNKTFAYVKGNNFGDQIIDFVYVHDNGRNETFCIITNFEGEHWSLKEISEFGQDLTLPVIKGVQNETT